MGAVDVIQMEVQEDGVVMVVILVVVVAVETAVGVIMGKETATEVDEPSRVMWLLQKYI
ncbi:Uncharacterised protein [Yersinia enterocolitica]|nr:Uncharacterised protein [Yersinia mollaretii]CNK14332.1 Uncharacterised protein [Yersinia enterocolitica]CQQ55841.1 Uncharacterised protein [Yersinia mollaretii]